MALGGAMFVKDSSDASDEDAQGGGARADGGGASLHDQLVAYTEAISGALAREERSGVWSEHSYARARGTAPSALVRVLLAPAALHDNADETLDVAGEPRAPPPPPDDSDDEEPAPAELAAEPEDDEWEERVQAHAPSAAHARLAKSALQALHDARLARLAGGGGRAARRREARATARRLRAALAPLWAGSGAPAPRPPAWLHAQLSAHLPASYRPLYDDALAELRRAVPRLAERLGAACLPPPADDPLAPEKETALKSAQAPGPWLAWVRCGCGRGEARWERRLGARLHTRVLRTPAAAAPPERWAAAALHAAKQALADVVEDAKGRAVIVGGAGAGAAMAAALAAGAGAGVRGALLVALSPLTAEGPRDLPDDVLHEVGVPVLAVCGAGGAGGAGALAGGARRVLVVAGADAALRLPLRARRALRLPQHALDAALVEEMARWCRELAAAPRDLDEYSHLPALAPLSPPPAKSRSVELLDGRVVTRASGCTPLLLPARRAPAAAPAAPPAPPAAPAPAPAALAAADIMQLPIVFADDEPPALAPIAAIAYPEGGAESVTVTSGARVSRRGADSRAVQPRAVRLGERHAPTPGPASSGGVRYTRVIVAKRGAGARGAGARGTVARGAGGRPRIVRH